MQPVTLPDTQALTERAEGVVGMLRAAGAVVAIGDETSALVASGLRVQALLDKVADDAEIAETITIDSPELLEEAQRVAGRLATVAADSGEIERERKALVAPLNAVVKLINAGYAAPREFLQGRVGRVRGEILRFDAEQKRIAAERAEAERRVREAAAAEAARKEAEARAQATALLAEAQKAQQSGADTVAHELAQQASQTIDAARQAANEAVQNLHTASTVAPATRAKGVTGKWRVEVVSIDNLILHIAERLRAGDRSLVTLLEVDEAAANRLAAVQQAGFNVPSLRAEFVPTVRMSKVPV